MKRSKEIAEAFLKELDNHLEELKAGKAESTFEVQDIATLLHIHPTHLSNTIQGELKRSPCDIYEEKLMSIAKELILTTDHSIAEIARQLTFDPSNFSNAEHDERVANMIFASVYPLYRTKVEQKERRKEELHQVIAWLTGFNDKNLQELIDAKVTFETFFQQAQINPDACLITGVICGYRVEEIENPLTQKVRYLDKLVDELAKGKKMEEILR